MAVLLLAVLYVGATWVVSWAVPRSLRRSRPDIPETVPQEWVDELREIG